MLSNIATASLLQQFFFLDWAIHLCADETSSLQPRSVSKGCQYVHGLIKTGIAKILSTASLSKKTPKVKPASSSLYLDGKQSWKLGLDTC